MAKSVHRVGLQKASTLKSIENLRLFDFLIAIQVLLFFRFSYVYAISKVDFAHDGTILPPSLAFLDGYNVNGEAFSQYGPVSAWINSLILLLPFDKPLLTLKIFDLLTLTACVVVTYVIAALHLNRISGFIGCTIWMLSAYYFTPGDWTYLAWPSTQGLFMLVLLLLITILMLGTNPRLKPSFFAFIPGLFLGALFFTRWHLATVVLIAYILVIFLALKSNSRENKDLASVLKSIVLWSFFWCLVISLYLILTNSFLNFVTQAVLAPSKYYPNQNGNALNLFANYFSRYASLLTFSLLGFIFLVSSGSKKLKSGILPEVFFMFTFCLAFLNLKGDPSIRTSVMYSLFLLGGVLLFRILIEWGDSPTQMEPRKLIELLIWLIGVFSLVQIYPTFDVRHGFWAGLLLCVLSIHRFLDYTSSRGFFPIIVILLSLLIGMSSDYGQSRPRNYIQVQSENILNGMYVTQEQYDYIKSVDLFYNELPVNKKYIFRCFDGLYSIWNSKFLSADAFWGDWPWQWTVNSHQMIRTRSYSGNFGVILCTDPGNAANWAKENGYLVIKSNDTLTYVEKLVN